MNKPWYMIEYEEKDYLHNKKLLLKDASFLGDDHRHCELCWERLSASSSDLHSGYYEPLSRSWICENCYSNFKDLFKWS